MNKKHPLPTGTPVAFDIAQGLAVGTGVVLKAEYDDGWAYHLEVTGGDAVDEHLNEDGELWVCDFEVRRLPNEAASSPGVAGSG